MGKTTKVRNVTRHALAVLCGALLTLPIGIVAVDRSQNTTPEAWVEQIDVCRPLDDSSSSRERTIECLDMVLASAITDEVVPDVAAAITALAAVDKLFYGFCHEAMHRVGKALLDHYNNPEDALRTAATIDCGNGLAHGVLDYWAAEPETELNRFPAVIAVCEETEGTNPGGCSEGIGHAAYQHQDESVKLSKRLDIAFKVCEQFSRPAQQTQCGYGVLMQPYLKQNKLTITEAAIPIPEQGELIEICMQVERDRLVVDGCYEAAGWLMGVGLISRFESGDFGDLGNSDAAVKIDALSPHVLEQAQFCTTEAVLPHRKERCLLQFFSRLPLFWYDDTLDLERRCSQYRTEESNSLEPFCIAGAYEFTPPTTMVSLLRRHPVAAELISDRWVRERGDELLEEFASPSNQNS